MYTLVRWVRDVMGWTYFEDPTTRMLVRKLWWHLNAEERAEASSPLAECPTWLTKERVEKLWADPSAPSATPPPTSHASSSSHSISPTEPTEPRTLPWHRLRDRACDVYMRENRVAIKEQAQKTIIRKKMKADTLYKLVGWKMFQALDSDKLKVCMDDVSLGPRMRDQRSGQFAQASPSALVQLCQRETEVSSSGLGTKRLGAELLKKARLALDSACNPDSKATLKVVSSLVHQQYTCLGHFQRLGLRHGFTKGDCSRVWKAHRSKQRRSRTGFRKLTSSRVKELLEQSSFPTSRYSFKTNTFFRMLEGSRKRVWNSSPELKSAVSYSRFCEWLKSGKLGFTNYKRRTDVCRLCHCYDSIVLPKGKTMAKELQHEVEAYCPDFFADFAEPTTDDFIVKVAAMLHFMEHKNFEPLQHAYTEAGFAHLQNFIKGKVGELKSATGLHTQLQLFGVHFGVRDHMQLTFRSHRCFPAPKTVYLAFDYKEFGA